MRYIIELEFRLAKPKGPSDLRAPYSSRLRSRLSQRNIQWAKQHGFPHEAMLSGTSAILYREEEHGRH